MKRFVECEDRRQGVLLPEYLDDYVSENNPVRVVDLFVDELDLLSLGFEGVVPEATGRPGYHPSRPNIPNSDHVYTRPPPNPDIQDLRVYDQICGNPRNLRINS